MTETLPGSLDERAEDESGSEPRPAEPGAESPRGRSFRRITATVLVVVLTLSAIAAVVALYLRQHTAIRVEQARTDAVRVAKQQLPKMLSYNHRSLDRDLAAARATVTGDFRREFTELQRSTIRPAAANDKISTKTSVSAAGVVRAQEQQVVVLAFINQVTSSERQRTPRTEGARVRLTMRQVGDRWLVSGMDTV